jgi:hypothetical protein
MSGWTVVDANTNKSQPITGVNSSGAVAPYFNPAPNAQDPVGKLRISTPQALIDTDFEYGTQPTKWETIILQNARPTTYYTPQSPITVTAITGNGTRTVTVTGTFSIPANTPIYIQNTLNPLANGWGYTLAGGVNTMSVLVSNTISASSIYNPALTYCYVGYFYSNSAIDLPFTSAFATNGSALVSVTTTNPHGLSAGSFIYVHNTTSSSTTINGPQVVDSVPSANTFAFTNGSGAVAAAAVTNSTGRVNLFARASGYVEPRSFDGGVAFSAGGVAPNQQLIRQTRRYFRYQSGKGIQFSTGTSLCPSLQVTSITGILFLAQVTTRFQHNLAVGCVIRVSGVDQGAFNGTFTVTSVTSPTVFTYVMNTNVGAVTATGQIFRVSPINWFGSSNRVGFMDQQNGLFFEYDGQQLYAVWRNSVVQINGTVTVAQGGSVVTGTGTQFLSQLRPGDNIVIRGQSHRVVFATTDAQLYITPEYRGAGISGAVVSKTIELRTPRSAWADPLDGTGPSGYTLDLTRMQMWYIDYSWYGAGFIRWGLRTAKGQITYVHQQQNNNLQFEAYMRSGNMAAHYESNGLGTVTSMNNNLLAGLQTTLSGAITAAATTITVATPLALSAVGGYAVISQAGIPSEVIFYTSSSGGVASGVARGLFGTAPTAWPTNAIFQINSMALSDASSFPNAGIVRVSDPSLSGAIEYISYAAKYGNFLYNLGRAQVGGAGAQNFLTTSSGQTAVELATPDTVASLSHWGSSVIMDGRYDDDKSLVFNYGMTAAITTTNTNPIVLMAIRLAPSVDNGTTGLLGVKEIINRAQLQLDSLGLYTTGTGYLINLVLNGFCSGAASGSFVAPIQQLNGVTSSFAQIALNTNPITVNGGESLFAAYSNASGNTTLDLSNVRDLGNSILGGGTVNTLPTSQIGFYPDGPDIVYIVATPLTATSSTILARLNWKEAQA